MRQVEKASLPMQACKTGARLTESDLTNCNSRRSKVSLSFNQFKEKINIPQIRTNSHELHSETRCWTIPKASLPKNIFHLCETMSVEDENHFLLEFPSAPTLDLNLKIFVTIQIFLTLEPINTTMSQERISLIFLRRVIKF